MNQIFKQFVISIFKTLKELIPISLIYIILIMVMSFIAGIGVIYIIIPIMDNFINPLFFKIYNFIYETDK